MLPNRYDFREAEPRLARLWEEAAVYGYDPAAAGQHFTIDTPPATVSGQLHIGHCYSYTQADVIARYRRMRGDHVYYPMGFDDNGLPTERFVEKTIKRKATEMGRESFIDACLELTRQTEDHFELLWRRLGLSVDWRYRYSTISAEARRVARRPSGARNARPALRRQRSMMPRCRPNSLRWHFACQMARYCRLLRLVQSCYLPVSPFLFIPLTRAMDICMVKRPVSTAGPFAARQDGGLLFPSWQTHWPILLKGAGLSCAALLGIRPMSAGGVRASSPCEQ